VTTELALRARSYNDTDADLQAIYALIRDCEAVDRTDDSPSVTELRTQFNAPDVDKAQDIRLWEGENGSLIAGSMVGISEKSDDDSESDGRLYFWVRPEARGNGLETEIIDWAAARLGHVGRERGRRAVLYAGARDFDAYRNGIIKAHGFEVARYFFRMSRDLSRPIPAPAFPEGFTFRHLKGVEEAAPWTEMFNLSFIDHWNHHPLSVQVAEHYMSSPEYVPERDLLAVAPDGTFAAFCFCEVNEEDNRLNNRKYGWIHLLGTRRGYRNIGLGRAMLLAGLRRLKEDGMEHALLGVDADNPTGALGLYERAGFEKVMTNVVYGREVSP
jgi:mycothiol synthase